LNKSLTKSIAVIVLAIFAFSAAATMSIGHATTYSFTPATGLVSPTTLTIAGSSTVYPVAEEEAAAFPGYWNALVAANPSWGASPITTAMQIAGAGSGTAIPLLTSGAADVGEMSRPPKSGTSNNEWQTTSGATGPTGDLQIWAVGVDSVGICVPTTIASWFPSALTTQEVAELFMDVPTGITPATTAAADTGLTSKQTSDYYVTTPYSFPSNEAPPYFTTWGQFLTYYYNGAIPASVTSAISTWGAAQSPALTATQVENSNIQRAVRDPTSGTFDCFDNYFIIPNGFEAEYKYGGNQVQDTTTLLYSQDMAPYTFCETNQIVQTTMENGGAWIGFISAGILAGDPKLTAINIEFNQDGTPNTFNNGVISWGPAVAPTIPNIKYAFSGLQGKGATAKYLAWRWLWNVTPGQIPSTGPLLETGVWIAYMRAINPMTLPTGGTAATATGTFMGDNQYIYLNPADCTGAKPIDSTLATYSPYPGQTQSIPDGVVNGADFFYFVDAYIAYYANGIYNPYADITAQGVINGASFFAFVSNYISYYTSYNPTS
jgi:ABC-type phosphate transport system substrate-binding protein